MAESVSREMILPALRLDVPPRPSDRQVAQGALDELVDHLLVVLSAQFDLPTDRSGMLAALAPRGAAKD